MRWLIALLLLGSVAFAQSSQPAQQQNTAPQQQSRPDNRGTEQVPSAVETLPTEHTKNKSDAAAANHVEQWFYGWNLSDRIAAIASVAAMLQFIALLFTVGIMIKTNHRQLRAYLSINPSFIENYGTKKCATINWVVKNHGQTPAFRIRYKFTIEVLSNPLPEGFYFPPPQHDVSPDSSLFPSGDDPNIVLRTWFHNDRPFTDEEFDGVENGSRRVHVWGVMTYRDSFKRNRTTLFNTSVGGPDFKEAMRQIRSGKTNPGHGYLWVHAGRHNQAT